MPEIKSLSLILSAAHQLALLLIQCGMVFSSNFKRYAGFSVGLYGYFFIIFSKYSR